MKAICQELFSRSWWVVFFMILCLVYYEQGLKERDHDQHTLQMQLSALQHEMAHATKLNHDLTRQLNSVHDPAWIETVLISELGVCPKGQTKVYFSE